MDFYSTFIEYNDFSSLLIQVFMVMEIILIVKNIIDLPSDPIAALRRSDIITPIDDAFHTFFCKIFQYATQSLKQSYFFVSQYLYPFFCGEIVENPDLHSNCHNTCENRNSLLSNCSSELAGTSSESRNNSGAVAKRHIRRSKSEEVFVRRLRSGTVYGMALTPVRDSNSYSRVRHFNNEPSINEREPNKNNRLQTVRCPEIINQDRSNNNENLYGNENHHKRRVGSTESILHFRRPRSMLQANLQLVRNLGYHARSGKK